MDVVVITSQAMQELLVLLFRTGLLKLSRVGDEERLSPPIQEDLSMLLEVGVGWVVTTPGRM